MRFSWDSSSIGSFRRKPCGPRWSPLPRHGSLRAHALLRVHPRQGVHHAADSQQLAKFLMTISDTRSCCFSCEPLLIIIGMMMDDFSGTMLAARFCCRSWCTSGCIPCISRPSWAPTWDWGTSHLLRAHSVPGGAHRRRLVRPVFRIRPEVHALRPGSRGASTTYSRICRCFCPGCSWASDKNISQAFFCGRREGGAGKASERRVRRGNEGAARFFSGIPRGECRRGQIDLWSA